MGWSVLNEVAPVPTFLYLTNISRSSVYSESGVGVEISEQFPNLPRSQMGLLGVGFLSVSFDRVDPQPTAKVGPLRRAFQDVEPS